MKRLLVGALTLALWAIPATAQSLEDLNIQIHGYATQGFLFTTNNNILTTTSSNGSPDWTEAVVNVGAQPTPKLRVGIQARYELLGNYSNAITLDWVAADYKVNDKFGVRFGKVKVPYGLFNETQDIDPSYIWGLLPQSIYPIASRNGMLSTFGGVAYGTVDLVKMGKLDYRGWSGEVSLAPSDGYFVGFAEAGLVLPKGQSNVKTGATLRWRTPLPGLMVGASDSRANSSETPLTAGNGALTGSFNITHYNQPDFFAKYEKDKLMVATEYNRTRTDITFQFAGPVAAPTPIDTRALYAMTSYKLAEKLTVGTYYSQEFNRSDPLGPGRYQKDWDVSGRYDFNQFLYAKAEQHFLDGTFLSYDADLNPNGLKPTTKLTVLKMGVSF